MGLENYRGLVVWQKAMDLVDSLYTLTRAFPADERFGLTSQIRRAAVSIPANIAEGYGRRHRGDYLRFLSIARGSLCEVETLMIISARQSFATKERLTPIWHNAQEVGKMLTALKQKLSPP